MYVSMTPVGGGGGLGQSPEMMLLSLRFAASIDFSPFTKISTRHSFAEAYLGHGDPPGCRVGPPFLFLLGGGSWHQHMKDPHGNNLQCGLQALCHSGTPHSATCAQTAVRS